MLKRRTFSESHHGMGGYGHRNPLYAPHHALVPRYLGPTDTGIPAHADSSSADHDEPYPAPPGPPSPTPGPPSPSPSADCININVRGPLVKVVTGPACGDVDVASAQLGLDRSSMEKRMSCGCSGHGHSHHGHHGHMSTPVSGYGHMSTPVSGYGHMSTPAGGQSFLSSLF